MSNITQKSEKNKNPTGEYIFAAILSIIVGILSILQVIIGWAQLKKGMVYLATGHYYLDYFEYVGLIAQGRWGKWLVENYFATDDKLKTFAGFLQYLIYGKIGKLFGFSVITTYWIIVFVFSTILAILFFKSIKTILSKESFVIQAFAYLFALFAAPFLKITPGLSGGLPFIPYTIWGDKGVFFRRFEAVPSHLFGLILTLILLLLLTSIFTNIHTFSKIKIINRAFFLGLLMIILLTFSPFNVILLLITAYITGLIVIIKSAINHNSKRIVLSAIFLALISILVLPAVLVMKDYYQSIDLFIRISQVETDWQVFPTMKEIILITGPIILFIPFGLIDFFRKLTVARLFITVFVITSYSIYFSPLALKLGTSNVRFFSSLNYILLSSMAILGIKLISRSLANFGKIFIILAVLFLLFYFALSNGSYFYTFILGDKSIFSPISYLNEQIIDGFNFLNIQSDEKAVLTTPSQFLGTLLPIYVNKRMYIARGVVTPDYDNKAIIVNNFFLGNMSVDTAESFLRTNRIGFIVLTSIEGYSPDKIKIAYPFLQVIFKNKDVTIFKFS